MQLKVLSWNIWVHNHFDLVKDFLSKTDADIIGLQEVSSNDASRDTIKHLKSLGYNYVFAPQLRTWAPDGRMDGPAIFTKLNIVSSKQFVLSTENGVGMVQADIQVENRTYHFFSTHLSHTHQKDSPVQSEQIDKLLKFIPPDFSVLMGDFNAIPNSQTIQKVKTFLVDVDPTNAPTWSVYPQGCEVCNPQKIDTRLDYIFTTKDINTQNYKVETSKGSDHLPISVVLVL